MSGFPVAQRDTFLIPSGTVDDPGRMHLFVVVSDPAKDASVLLVNASTVYSYVPHDGTCYLDPGDHPFIKVKSYIAYQHARIILVQRLQTLIAARQIFPRSSMPPVVFQRIVDGIAASPHMDPAKIQFQDTFG